MDQDRAVVLDHDDPRGQGQVGREPPGVVDLAAGDDETHYCLVSGAELELELGVVARPMTLPSSVLPSSPSRRDDVALDLVLADAEVRQALEVLGEGAVLLEVHDPLGLRDPPSRRGARWRPWRRNRPTVWARRGRLGRGGRGVVGAASSSLGAAPGQQASAAASTVATVAISYVVSSVLSRSWQRHVSVTRPLTYSGVAMQEIVDQVNGTERDRPRSPARCCCRT